MELHFRLMQTSSPTAPGVRQADPHRASQRSLAANIGPEDMPTPATVFFHIPAQRHATLTTAQ